jgi:hypothetical protein
MAGLFLNDRDIADYGCDLARPITGWMAFPIRQLPGVALVGSHGEVLTGTGVRTQPRRLDLTLYRPGTSVAERRSGISQLFQALNGKVQIRLSDDPNRFVEAYLIESNPTGPGFSEFTTSAALIPLSFLAVDPLYYAVLPWDRPVLPSIRTVIPMGTAGSRIEIDLMGASTSTLLRFRHGSTGAVLYDMTLTGTPSSSEFLRLRFSKQTIKRYSGTPAAETDSYSWKGSLDVWPVIDPADGAVTVELVGGTPGRGIMRGRVAYLS